MIAGLHLVAVQGAPQVQVQAQAADAAPSGATPSFRDSLADAGGGVQSLPRQGTTVASQAALPAKVPPALQQAPNGDGAAEAVALTRLAEKEGVASLDKAGANSAEGARESSASTGKDTKVHRHLDTAEEHGTAPSPDAAGAQASETAGGVALPSLPVQPFPVTPAGPPLKPPSIAPAASRVAPVAAKPAIRKSGLAEGRTDAAKDGTGAAKDGTGAAASATKVPDSGKSPGVQSSDAPGVAASAPSGSGSQNFVSVFDVQSAASHSPAASPPASSPGAAQGHAASSGAGAVESDPGSAVRTGVADYAGQRTLVATAHVLEVGLTGGAHGWLRVRAELGETGKVTASLVASNAGAAEALNKQTGAIADYLKSAAVGVSSLVITAAEKTSGAPGTATYAGGGAAPQSHAEQRGQQGSSQPSSGLPDWRTMLAQPAEGGPASLAGFGLPGGLPGGSSGGWLNVMA